MGWRVAWLQAQIAGLVFSSIVWLVVAGLSLPAATSILVAGASWVLSRNTRAGLWWRFGARAATSFERDLVHAAIVPIAFLRGRHQPTIWVGRRTGDDDAIMPTLGDLVVSTGLLGRMAGGRLSDDQVRAVVSSASGRQPVTGSALVASIDACVLRTLAHRDDPDLSSQRNCGPHTAPVASVEGPVDRVRNGHDRQLVRQAMARSHQCRPAYVARRVRAASSQTLADRAA